MPDSEPVDRSKLVDAYFASDGGKRSEELLARLMDEIATDAIRNYFKNRINTSNDSSSYRFTRSDAEDLESVAKIQTIVALRRLHSSPIDTRIENFEAYTKSICYSVYSDFWRKRFADYHKLKNRIRYLLTRDELGFVVSRIDKRTIVCSLRAYREHESKTYPPDIVEFIKETVEDFPVRDEIGLMHDVLDYARGWLMLDSLVGIVAELRGISEIPPSETAHGDDYLERVAPRLDAAEVQHGHVLELAGLWGEIRGLPRLQKLALLYHLRDTDGRELNSVWFEAGVASLTDLAAEFEVNREEMPNLLVRLPLSDKAIAETLGIENREIEGKVQPKEKRVSNLRKVAREYLQRRIDGRQKRGG